MRIITEEIHAMNNAFPLSPDEARFVEAILAPLSARAKHQLTLDHLLQRWNMFVNQVAQGYHDSIYEYTNDLGTRDTLENVLQQVPQPLHDRLNGVLHSIDRRFIDRTTSIQRSLGTSQYPWWFRIPKNLSDELRSDLRSEGIIQ